MVTEKKPEAFWNAERKKEAFPNTEKRRDAQHSCRYIEQRHPNTLKTRL